MTPENKSAATKAFDAISELCGAPEWEYPGQVVRDVEQLKCQKDSMADRVVELEAENERLNKLIKSDVQINTMVACVCGTKYHPTELPRKCAHCAREVTLAVLVKSDQAMTEEAFQLCENCQCRRDHTPGCQCTNDE